MKTFMSSLLALGVLLVAGGPGKAQEADLQTQVEDLQQRYELAIRTGYLEPLPRYIQMTASICPRSAE